MDIKDCKLGMKVKFIDEKSHKRVPDFFPPVGTVGIISELKCGNVQVQWKKGSTSGDDNWYCRAESIKKVETTMWDSFLRFCVKKEN